MGIMDIEGRLDNTVIDAVSRTVVPSEVAIEGR